MSSARYLKIKDAEDICEMHGAQAVAIFMIVEDGTAEWVTYGTTKKKCRVIGEWFRKTLKVSGISKIPFQTIFGYGFNGVPTRVTPEEEAVAAAAHPIIKNWLK